MQLHSRMPDGAEARQHAKDPLDDDFADLVKATLDRWKVPGLAIAVVDGEHVYSQGYGVSNDDHTPVTPQTNFYAGSTTKAFTAAALAALVEDEKYPDVQWTTPVNHLIRDDFVLADAWATDHLTLEDILSHRTGLASHDPSHGGLPTTGEQPQDAPKPAVRELVRRLRYLPLTAEPRTTYQYCNAMFITAAHVVEALTGQWLGTFLRDRIWKPLGMDSTYFSTEDAKSAPETLSKGYKWDEREEKYVEISWMNLDADSGAGSVISNVMDYSRWARALLDQAPPLSKASWQELTRPRSIAIERTPLTGIPNYALGWHVGSYRGHRVWEHTGGMNAFGADFILFPDLKYAVVGFGNTAGSSGFAEQALLWKLIDDRLGVPLDQRLDWNKRYGSERVVCLVAYETRNDEVLRAGKEEAQQARQRFYPSLPDPLLPPTIPLEAYAGTYFDAGYHTLKIEISSAPPSQFLRPFLQSSSPKKSTTQRSAEASNALSNPHLVASRSTSLLPEFLTFQHMSGNFFIAWSEYDADFGAWWPDSYPVEFRIGADGKVTEVGIRWELQMKDTEKIWFKRTGP